MQRSVGLSVLIATAGVAHADEPPSEATVLFERGRALVRDGKDVEACPLFEQSMRLAPALGTELNLARCYAATGRLVEARAMFASLIPRTADQPQRQQLAQEGLDGVTGRIPSLAIDASALPAATEIHVDGKPVDATAPVPVDPGHHRVDAPGARPAVVDVVEGKQAQITLIAIASASRPKLIYALGGAAGGVFVIGAITGVMAVSSKHDALDHCDDSLACDRKGLDLLDRARTLSHVSTAFVLTGLGLAAATVYLELRWRKHREEPIAAAWADRNGVGVGVACVW